jgi:ketosteroid isomerase-like protein
MTTEVLDLVHRWAAAEQANDPARIDDLLAPEFVGVGPLGFVLTREQWLARFANGLENRAFAVEEATVHDHGAAALVVGVDAQETFFAGGENSGRFRLSLVAVRADDRWLVAGVHIGPLQGGPPARPGS